MTLTSVHHLHEVEGLFGRLPALAGTGDQQLGWHHTTVKPVNRTAASNAAHHADIRARNLRMNVGDEVFRETKCIGRIGRLVVHSHFVLSPPQVREQACALSDTRRKLNRARSHPYYDGARVEIESTQAVPTTEQVVS